MIVESVFGPWRPDFPDYNNPGVTVARNVTPRIGANGVAYGPLKRASVFSEATMDSRPLGAAIGQDSLGNAKVYAGCSTKLYKIDAGTRQWVDVSRAAGYNTSDGEQWRAAQFGNGVIFTNGTDFPQIINADIDLQYEDLTTLTKGKYVGIFKGFTILGNTWDAFDGFVPNRIRWSADGNPYDFNFSVATQSDFQDIHDFGSINGIVCDEYVWVLMQKGIIKMTYIGAPYVFQVEPAMIGKGCTVPQSVVTVAGKTFFLSEDGFYMMEKGQFVNIGDGKVNKHFLADADTQNFSRMTAAADPQETLVYWLYSSRASSDGDPDKMIIYNYLTGEWSEAEATTGYIFNSVSLPWTIDQLDVFGSIDNVPASFDSPLWAGGQKMLWGMSETGAIHVFGGTTLPATIETQETYLINALRAVDPKTVGDKSTILSIRPIFDGTESAATVSVGSRALSNDAVEWSQPKSIKPSSGNAYLRQTGRYHRIRMRTTGDWSALHGLQIDANPAGFK